MYKWVKYICSVGVACVAIVLLRYVCISFTYVLKLDFCKLSNLISLVVVFFWTSNNQLVKIWTCSLCWKSGAGNTQNIWHCQIHSPFPSTRNLCSCHWKQKLCFFPSYKAFFVQVSVSCTHALTIWYPAVNLGNLALSDLIHSISMKWQFWSNSSLFFLYGEISLHRQSSVT